MDFGAPVAQDVQTPNAIQTLSNLTSLQSAVQGLQTQRNTQALQQQEIQRSQIQTQQDQGVNQFFSSWDPGQHHADDGTLDIDSAHGSPQYQSLPGVAKIAVDAKLNTLKGQQLQNKQALTQLNGEVVGQFGKLSQALSTNPNPDDVKQQLTLFAQQGPDQARIAQIYGPMLQKVPPEKLSGALKTMGAQAQDVSAQQAQTNPAQMAVNKGGSTEIYNVDKSKGLQPGQKPAAEVTNTLAPQVITMPNQSLATVGGAYGAPPGAGGGGRTAAAPPHPRTAADDAPPANAPKAVQDAYQAAVQKANGHVEDVRTADESYGNNTAISNAIRQLSKGANTGPGTETWNHVMGVLGTDKANNAQELGAFLDRQAATVRGQMGLPGTNAGAEDAKSIVGNTGYNAKVIQDKNDYTQALTEGLHQYRNGLDRVAGFSGQASPSTVNSYKAAWAQNFDPNVYKGELAYKRSKAEGDAFVKSLSPEEAASLAQKRAQLQALSKGQLPQ